VIRAAASAHLRHRAGGCAEAGRRGVGQLLPALLGALGIIVAFAVTLATGPVGPTPALDVARWLDHRQLGCLPPVCIAREDGTVRFQPLPPPNDAEVCRVTALVARRIARLLERRGLGPWAGPEEAEESPHGEPLLGALYGASVQGRIATGRRAGQRVTRLGDRIEVEELAVPHGPRCAAVAGVSVHANVGVPATADPGTTARPCGGGARPTGTADLLSQIGVGSWVVSHGVAGEGCACHALRHPVESDLSAGCC
jgi:hypothetical protein